MVSGYQLPKCGAAPVSKVDPDNPDQFDSGTDSEDEDAEENG